MTVHDDNEKWTRADADRADEELIRENDEYIEELEQEEEDRQNDGDNPNP